MPKFWHILRILISLQEKTMDIIRLEKILLEYFKTTDPSWKYTIKAIQEIPTGVSEIRSVSIRGRHIKFYEEMHIEKSSSTVYWMFDLL